MHIKSAETIAALTEDWSECGSIVDERDEYDEKRALADEAVRRWQVTEEDDLDVIEEIKIVGEIRGHDVDGNLAPLAALTVAKLCGSSALDNDGDGGFFSFSISGVRTAEQGGDDSMIRHPLTAILFPTEELSKRLRILQQLSGPASAIVPYVESIKKDFGDRWPKRFASGWNVPETGADMPDTAELQVSLATMLSTTVLLNSRVCEEEEIERARVYLRFSIAQLNQDQRDVASAESYLSQCLQEYFGDARAISDDEFDLITRHLCQLMNVCSDLDSRASGAVVLAQFRQAFPSATRQAIQACSHLAPPFAIAHSFVDGTTLQRLEDIKRDCRAESRVACF